jgi:hypothetical protein
MSCKGHQVSITSLQGANKAAMSIKVYEQFERTRQQSCWEQKTSCTAGLLVLMAGPISTFSEAAAVLPIIG